MTFDVSDMYAEVRKQTDAGVYIVKVNFPAMGMYINGWRVQPSQKAGEELWVQPPAIRVGSRWQQVTEFNTHMPFYGLIKDAILRAVAAYSEPEPDIVVEDISDEPIDLTDLPF